MAKRCFLFIALLSVVLGQAAPDYRNPKVSSNITFYRDDSIKSIYYVFPYYLSVDSIKGHPNMYVNSFFQTTDKNTIFNKNEISITLKKYKLNNKVISEAFSKIKTLGNENYKYLAADKINVQLFIPDTRTMHTDTLDLLSEEEMIKQIDIEDKLILYKSLRYVDVSLMRETIFKHNTPLKIAYTFQTITCNTSGPSSSATGNACTLKSELIPFLIAQSDSERVFTQKHIKIAPTPAYTGVTVSNFDYCNGINMLDSALAQKIEAIQSKKIIINGESSGKKKAFTQTVFKKGDMDCSRYIKFKTAIFINKPISYTIVKVMEDGNIVTSKPVEINDWNQIDISETYDN